MSSFKILVYEDVPAIATGWAEKIKEALGHAEVKTPGKDDFLKLIELANERRALWREKRNQADFIRDHEADEAKIVVADFDLIHYSGMTDTTGSSLAYLLRCFTQCGFIIILNQYEENDFDLNLERRGEDFADLHVGGPQVGNPGLWKTQFKGYRPWHWPITPNASENFERCVQEVRDNPDSPILEFLGLADKTYWMSQRVLNLLSGSQQPEEVTFGSFVKTARGGIARKDELPPGQGARVTAARIITLLNRIVLPQQNLLVDAPHLVSRFPSLMRSGSNDIEDWNRLCAAFDDSVDDFLSDNLGEHKFPKPHWLWRPAWLWPEISRNDRIEEVKNPWAFVEPSWVFCENVSKFLPQHIADSFRADVSPPFTKRFVFREDPTVAAGQIGDIVRGSILDPSIVKYEPQTAFSE